MLQKDRPRRDRFVPPNQRCVQYREKIRTHNRSSWNVYLLLQGKSCQGYPIFWHTRHDRHFLGVNLNLAIDEWVQGQLEPESSCSTLRHAVLTKRTWEGSFQLLLCVSEHDLDQLFFVNFEERARWQPCEADESIRTVSS